MHKQSFLNPLLRQNGGHLTKVYFKAFYGSGGVGGGEG